MNASTAPEIVIDFHVLDQNLHDFSNWWSAFLSVIRFVISPVILNSTLPSVQNGFRCHQCKISSCLWIADEHCADEPFLLDGKGMLNLLLPEVPFEFLILLPDQRDFWDD